MTAATIVALCVTALMPFAMTPLTRIQHKAATLAAAGILVAAVGVCALLAHAADAPHGAARIITIIAATLAAVSGGGIVVRAVLLLGGISPWASDSAAEPADTETPVSDADDAAAQEISGPLRGGRLIGFLERASVAAVLLAHWPAGLAIILALKGLARYPELREPHAAEQFIIGTFTSVLWAAAAAGAGYLLLA